MIAAPEDGVSELFHPVTDGHNVVYGWRQLGSSRSLIILHTAADGEIELSTGVRAGTHLANDGWIAFTRMDTTDNQEDPAESSVHWT